MSSVQSTDHVVAVSEMVRRSLRCTLPVTLIPNGVDAKRIAASRPRPEVRSGHGFSPTDFVTGLVGRFSPEKRPELLIRALSLLSSNHKGLFVGYGPMEHELMRLANQLIPGRYAFAFADDYLGDYYGAMDCFCLASQAEGFALVLLEAMMSGKAIVSTNVGGVPQLIKHRQNGVIVDSTPESIAAAIQDIASSVDWARGIAAAAAKVADEVGHASQMARRYERLFATLCRANS
jgi:glycosyltransferase involved in cell wall biosynthesis